MCYVKECNSTLTHSLRECYYFSTLTFPSSAAVAQVTVNHLVAGSNPASGAN